MPTPSSATPRTTTAATASPNPAIYLVYLPAGGVADLDLAGVEGRFRLHWFNPRDGGALQPALDLFQGGATARLQAPDAQDWLAVVRRVP